METCAGVRTSNVTLPSSSMRARMDAGNMTLPRSRMRARMHAANMTFAVCLRRHRAVEPEIGRKAFPRSSSFARQFDPCFQ